MSRSNPDIHSAGQSKLVPFDPLETKAERHDRRRRVAIETLLDFAEWAKSRGFTLRVRNQKEHFILSGTNPTFIAEWWPGTAKYVFNKTWDRGVHAHDWTQVRDLVERKIRKLQAGQPAPKTTPPSAPKPMSTATEVVIRFTSREALAASVAIAGARAIKPCTPELKMAHDKLSAAAVSVVVFALLSGRIMRLEERIARIETAIHAESVGDSIHGQ